MPAMLSAPLSDFAMVTREQHLRYRHVAELSGLGILGIFEIIAIREAFDLGGSLPAKHAGE